MLDKGRRLKKNELNTLFINGLDSMVSSHSGEDSAPLLIDLAAPLSLKLRVYLFNCTNPPGGRALDEYKIQIILPGQQRGQRGTLDYSDGRMPILAAYVQEGDDGVFVMWDADKHEDFSYSANMQVKADVIIQALYSEVASYTRKNKDQLFDSFIDKADSVAYLITFALTIRFWSNLKGSTLTTLETPIMSYLSTIPEIIALYGN